MDLFKPHHLSISAEQVAGNGDRGRVFFLPGSGGRARRIGERFLGRETVASDRQLDVHLGRFESDGVGVDVGAVATGMGCPSLDIVVTELILLGARTFVRVGTAGSLQPERVRVGDLVIATAAVRDEGTSDSYCSRDVPAVADPEVVRSLERAAVACDAGENTIRGIVHTKDSLFAREFGHGPQCARNRDYMRQLKELGVLATEMESAHLFVLAHCHSSVPGPVASSGSGDGVVRAGAVLAIIGDDGPFAPPDAVAAVEGRVVDVALRAAVELLR